MSHRLRFSEAALDDIQRLYMFLADRDIEAADDMPFDEFLRRYFAQT